MHWGHRDSNITVALIHSMTRKLTLSAIGNCGWRLRAERNCAIESLAADENVSRLERILLGFAARTNHIPNMASKKLRWRISRIRGSKAELLGVVTAANEQAAIREAIDSYKITSSEQQRRLVARREDT